MARGMVLKIRIWLQYTLISNNFKVWHEEKEEKIYFFISVWEDEKVLEMDGVIAAQQCDCALCH